MNNPEKTMITVQTDIKAPIEKVWEFWTSPEHITRWNHASDDWHTPYAENDLRTGGVFLSRMEAKDGSMGFDFKGAYTRVEPLKNISYRMEDGREADVKFTSDGQLTTVTETFEAETEHPDEMQRQGWQAILDNFRVYAERSLKFTALHFDITIHASPARVYQMMLDRKHYSDWTSVFNPTSRFEGSWEKGTKIMFLGTGEDGSQGGMISRIVENIPYKFVSIMHEGIIQNGTEITQGQEVEEWAGGFENYTFRDDQGKTLLSIDLDSTPGFVSYFHQTYPLAMNRLKEICESGSTGSK